MENLPDDDRLPDLTESLLMRSAPADLGWEGDLSGLPNEAIARIREKLNTRLAPRQVDRVLLDLGRAFGTAVEMAKAECALRHTVNRQRAAAKKPSAKLGVQLRKKLAKLRARFEGDPTPDHRDMCARILDDPVLERLVTPFIEERMGGIVPDPLRYSTSVAIRHLPHVLDLLCDAVDRGVATGKAEPALNFLAERVVRAVFHETGKTLGRTWDDHTREEKGMGVEICRLLAAALNDALPEGFRRQRPADMAKPFRKAIEKVREDG